VGHVQRTNVYLYDGQLRALKHVAAEERQSVAGLVRKAVDGYLATRMANDAEWQQRWDHLLESVQSRIPPDIPPEEIEADITAAREEVRQEHRASNRR